MSDMQKISAQEKKRFTRVQQKQSSINFDQVIKGVTNNIGVVPNIPKKNDIINDINTSEVFENDLNDPIKPPPLNLNEVNKNSAPPPDPTTRRTNALDMSGGSSQSNQKKEK